MAIQFCKFQETLFRKIVVIDEYYYQLKINAIFFCYTLYNKFLIITGHVC
jgi:hypothetical protein